MTLNPPKVDIDIDTRTETITFEVTQKDIERGYETSPWHCPIARALKRKFGESWAVSSNSIYIECSLDDTSRKFIQDFDSKIAVSPFVGTATRIVSSE